MSNPPKKILEDLTPLPWNVPLSKKVKTHFLKKQKILFPHLNIRIYLNVGELGLF